jgi:hypothetical protein
LGGNWVILKASCTTCSEITRDFEQSVSRRMLGPMRLQFGFRTRRKKERPSTIRVDVHHNQRIEPRHVPIEDSPTLPVVLPKFGMPGILESGLQTIGFGNILDLWIWEAKPEGEQQRRLEGVHKQIATALSVRYVLDFKAFCRMLVKIAHSATIAHFGPDHVVSILPEYILGKNDALRFVVGGSPVPIVQATPEMGWCIETGTYQAREMYLTIKIELFRFLNSPTYWVVVGPVSDRSKGGLPPALPPQDWRR